ncbi:membrane protein involved in colicin uptake [Solibacillus kalamii]|uniref:RNA polymerase subunit sigma n=1 Tax=Solibacillus kalamii TaxID=1748298 RepID=A0ABX3ZKZ6_9BACL|nr:RNA polymerase subunit sigma [Solibacillus kalamii]MBM7665192.1 membrane protein involved in colicin uptake [Solibacillus kalamii]OUZ40448.1 RNA polymerase subunit sigma [Solibacillus kalamii]
MSLKGLELQIAIPKTFEAGKMADQRQQNTILQQMHANEALNRELERKQLSVNETEHLNALNDEEQDKPSQNGQEQTQENKKNKEQLEQKVQHPFKGNLFDFSG